jgi:hypothetical protein
LGATGSAVCSPALADGTAAACAAEGAASFALAGADALDSGVAPVGFGGSAQYADASTSRHEIGAMTQAIRNMTFTGNSVRRRSVVPIQGAMRFRLMGSAKDVPRGQDNPSCNYTIELSPNSPEFGRDYSKRSQSS